MAKAVPGFFSFEWLREIACRQSLRAASLADGSLAQLASNMTNRAEGIRNEP
jgi:hypothetical protein